MPEAFYMISGLGNSSTCPIRTTTVLPRNVLYNIIQTNKISDKKGERQ